MCVYKYVFMVITHTKVSYGIAHAFFIIDLGRASFQNVVLRSLPKRSSFVSEILHVAVISLLAAVSYVFQDGYYLNHIIFFIGKPKSMISLGVVVAFVF